MNSKYANKKCLTPLFVIIVKNEWNWICEVFVRGGIIGSHPCLLEIKWYNHLAVLLFLNIHLPANLATRFLGLWPNENMSVQSCICEFKWSLYSQ